jgi:hypothetical protein
VAQLRAVLDVVGTPGRYQVQHNKPVASQRRTKQTPETAPLELREYEDHQYDPHQRQEHAQFDSRVHRAGCRHKWYADSEGRDDERRNEQCSETVAQGLNLCGCGIHVRMLATRTGHGKVTAGADFRQLAKNLDFTGAADKAVNLVGCKSPTTQHPSSRRTQGWACS